MSKKDVKKMVPDGTPAFLESEILWKPSRFTKHKPALLRYKDGTLSIICEGKAVLETPLSNIIKVRAYGNATYLWVGKWYYRKLITIDFASLEMFTEAQKANIRNGRYNIGATLQLTEAQEKEKREIVEQWISLFQRNNVRVRSTSMTMILWILVVLYAIFKFLDLIRR